MTKTHVWMHHPANPDGYWQCPVEGVEDFLARGWELSDPPPEPNPAIAERLAFEAELAAQAETDAAQAKADARTEAAAEKKRATKATKSATRSGEPDD